MYTEASKKAVNKYNAKAYDQIPIRVPKGKREEYKAQAEMQGMSLNALVISLIEKDMER